MPKVSSGSFSGETKSANTNPDTSKPITLTGQDYFRYFPQAVASEFREKILDFARKGIRKPKDVTVALNSESNPPYEIKWTPKLTAKLLKYVFEPPKGEGAASNPKLPEKGAKASSPKAKDAGVKTPLTDDEKRRRQMALMQAVKAGGSQ